MEILLPRAELEFWHRHYRDNVLYFYNEFRNRWKWDWAVSDRAVQGEVTRLRPMSE